MLMTLSLLEFEDFFDDSFALFYRYFLFVQDHVDLTDIHASGVGIEPTSFHDPKSCRLCQQSNPEIVQARESNPRVGPVLG